MCDQCDGGEREPNLSQGERTTYERLLNCEEQHGCELAPKLAGAAFFGDGIIYSGNWAVKRVVRMFGQLTTALEIESGASCETGCIFRDTSEACIKNAMRNMS